MSIYNPSNYAGSPTSAVTYSYLTANYTDTNTINSALATKLSTSGGTLSGDIVPQTMTNVNLGSSSAPFNEAYINTANVTTLIDEKQIATASGYVITNDNDTFTASNLGLLGYDTETTYAGVAYDTNTSTLKAVKELADTIGPTTNLGQANATLEVGTLQIDGSSAGSIGISGPSSITSYTLTLPSAQNGASGAVITSDTSGNLSFNSLITAGSDLITLTGNVAVNTSSTTETNGILLRTDGANVMSTYWTNSEGCQIYDNYNDSTWLYQGGTTPGYVATTNNTLDDGSGNMVVEGYMAVNSSSTTETPYIFLRADGTNQMSMYWTNSQGCELYDNYNAKPWLYQAGKTAGYVATNNNTLDDGSGNMTVKGNLTVDGTYPASSYASTFTTDTLNIGSTACTIVQSPISSSGQLTITNNNNDEYVNIVTNVGGTLYNTVSVGEGEINLDGVVNIGSAPSIPVTTVTLQSGNPAGYASGTTLTDIVFYGNFGEGVLYGAQIKAIAGGTWSSTSNPTSIVISTTPSDSVTPATALTIGGTTAGYVATSNNVLDDGTGKMTVNVGSTGHPTVLTLQSNVDTYGSDLNGALLEFATYYTANDTSYFQAAIQGIDPNYNEWGSGSGGLQFLVYNAATKTVSLTLNSNLAVSTANNTLDDGSGNMTVAGTLNVNNVAGQNGGTYVRVGYDNTNYPDFAVYSGTTAVFSVNNSSTYIDSSVTTLKNILDDGQGNMTVNGLDFNANNDAYIGGDVIIGGLLSVNPDGGFLPPFVSLTSGTTLNIYQGSAYFYCSGSTGFTVTLPKPTDTFIGTVFNIIANSATGVTFYVATQSAQYIYGTLITHAGVYTTWSIADTVTVIATQPAIDGCVVKLIYDGSNWMILSCVGWVESSD